MILDSDLPELKHYRSLERNLPIEFAPHFGAMVVAENNESLPVHRWFKYKEAYSPNLVWRVLDLFGTPNGEMISIMDPFCGVGTTLLSAQVQPSRVKSALGIERNPLSAFIARTKISWPNITVKQFDKLRELVLNRSRDRIGALPELSSIRTGRCISKYIASRLVAIRDEILQINECPERDALLVGLASAIEPLSHVRKDGRALRTVDRRRKEILPVLSAKWDEIRNDLQTTQSGSSVANVTVFEADGRRPRQAGVKESSIDVVFTSPPYPNNIDYSEVYKLELWLLGFIDTSESFLSLRKQTLRSHPTSDLASDPDDGFLRALKDPKLASYFNPLLERTASFKQSWRKRLAVGYFSDLWTALEQQYACLKPGGRSIVVVANSLHGSHGMAYLIPTDILVSQIGRTLGFVLERILIARNTKRRLSGNHFLRESIVVLRKDYAN